MKNEKPNYRIEKYNHDSSEAGILVSASLRKGKQNLQDKTFCFCNPQCDCNPVCTCERDCTCDDYVDPCKNHCYCVDHCKGDTDCPSYCPDNCVCVTSPH